MSSSASNKQKLEFEKAKLVVHHKRLKAISWNVLSFLDRPLDNQLAIVQEIQQFTD
ncbi:MAG TPA: hypothetical protein VE244_04780 [Nitrososphaeraceae archaeon]|nr:hypothetical protein [Nitrososphaeraceae archaeon]